MKIAELKQPYRRMAEYLAEKNTDEYYDDKKVLCDAFNWEETNDKFWLDINKGYYPPITEEIKKHFPPDFDFSGEDIKTKPVIQMLDAETQKTIYTQLAKEGKFDQLPNTCEFSEPVELEAGGDEFNKDFRKITGKYKGCYMDILYIGWQYAQLPTPKIDFSEFKSGDILEITNKDNEKYYGLLRLHTITNLIISYSYKSDMVKNILKEDIKSITKIK